MTREENSTSRMLTHGPCSLAVSLGLAGATACGDSTNFLESSSTTGTTQVVTAEAATTQGVPTGTQTSTTMAGTASSTTGGMGPLLPAYQPRWVLRDKDGARVQALVEPRCNYPYTDCWPPDFGPPNSIPCVRVISHEGKYINFWFNLASGELGTCHWDLERANQLGKTWKDLGAAFANNQCAGTVYGPILDPIGGEFIAARRLFYAEDDLWFQSEEGCLDAQFWVGGMGTCNGPTGVTHLCPIIVVPDWVKTLLPNPPYSIAVEYK